MTFIPPTFPKGKHKRHDQPGPTIFVDTDGRRQKRLPCGGFKRATPRDLASVGASVFRIETIVGD